jgi:hypothetical protein
MQVNLDKVIDALSNQVAQMTKDSIVLRLIIEKQQEELEVLRASQVKEEGSGIPPQASTS